MENTIKENAPLTEKKTLREKIAEKRYQIDLWSRKKPLRRKLYLNRYLYLITVLYFYSITSNNEFRFKFY